MVNNNEIRIERLELGPWGTNAYIITCMQTRTSALIDAPSDASRIMKSLEDATPEYMLLTHSHSDHTGALMELRKRLKSPLAVHREDSGMSPCSPEILLNHGDLLPLGKLIVEVLHTPGHTAGSLCFRIGKYLLAGDTIFPGGPGKTGTPYDFAQIVKSITSRIFPLPDDTEIYPGHGDSTTLQKAKEEFAVFSSRSHSPHLFGDVLWLSS